MSINSSKTSWNHFPKFLSMISILSHFWDSSVWSYGWKGGVGLTLFCFALLQTCLCLVPSDRKKKQNKESWIISHRPSMCRERLPFFSLPPVGSCYQPSCCQQFSLQDYLGAGVERMEKRKRKINGIVSYSLCIS